MRYIFVLEGQFSLQQKFIHARYIIKCIDEIHNTLDYHFILIGREIVGPKLCLIAAVPTPHFKTADETNDLRHLSDLAPLA